MLSDAAGAVAIAVPTGPHPAPELREAGADVVLASLVEFPDWLRSWREEQPFSPR